MQKKPLPCYLAGGLLAAVVALFSGCAHPYNIAPDTSHLSAQNTKPIDINVGYYIAAADLEKEVITPGGGGDKVKYTPYKDLEPALFKVLSNVFRRAYRLSAVDDKATIQEKNITFIIVPRLETNSSSDSALTWPPTWFMIKLDCQALDSEGKVVWTQEIKCEGKASFSEFKRDFPLAARRATEELMIELQRSLSEAPAFKK